MPTQAEFAKHMGVTQQAISKLVQKDVLPKGGTMDEWRHAYVRHLIDLASGHLSEDGELDITEERALLARAQRLKIEIETEKLRGSLVTAAQVEQVWTAHIAAARAKLLALPTKAAPQVLALKNRTDVEGLLKAIVHEALAELAEYRVEDYNDGGQAPAPEVAESIEPEPAPSRAKAKRTTPRKAPVRGRGRS